MLRSAALLVCAVVTVLASMAEPAMAQPKRQQAAPPPPPVNDPNALAAWCNQMVFRTYGQRAPLYGPRIVAMDSELQARTQNSCIMSKGRNF